jgi:endoglucanase
VLLGWNLGNTLDAPDGETTLGNPVTSPAMMETVAAAGFGTVRIPVTWERPMGGAPDYAVDQGWMDRVEEVASYVLSTGMYACVISSGPDINLSRHAADLGIASVVRRWLLL